MTLTYQQLQDNYFFWILTFICQNSDPPTSDFVYAGTGYTITTNDTGSLVISSWNSEITNCEQPIDEELMEVYNPDDYIPYKNSYQLQYISSSIALKTTTSTDFTKIDQNEGIAPYVMIYNTDTKQILFKINQTDWTSIFSISQIPESKKETTDETVKTSLTDQQRSMTPKEMIDKLKTTKEKTIVQPDPDYELI